MKAAPIYIQRIEVENVKTFAEKVELRLTKPDGTIPKWTLILGDNGIGKSTLLQLIAWMKPILPYDAKIPEDFIPAPMINDEENETLEQLVHKSAAGKQTATIHAVFVANQLLNEPAPTQPSLCETTMTIGVNRLGKLDKVSPEFKVFPASKPEQQSVFYRSEVEVYAYSASRQLGHLNLNEPKLLDTIPGFIKEKTELYDAEEILHTLNYASFGSKDPEDKKKYAVFIDRVKEMLVALLPDFEEIERIEINPPKVLNHEPEGGIVISTKHGQKIPFGDFSLGYKTVTSWTIDLAWRLFNKHHATAANPLLEPAIVLIDEIDLHLHPLWQQDIMANLSKHFPNIQFIASAHSPLMVQAAVDSNYAVLKFQDENVHINNEPEGIDGWRIDQILTSDLFGLKSARGTAYNKLVAQREALLIKPKLTKQEKADLTTLTEKLTELPTGENRVEMNDRKLISDLIQQIKDNNVKLEL
ncbi:MAG: hypothetical protein EOP45_10485 [Sphingobacteriaceae bacterium]|nr:MAG: hypothetical protein EOP45_10485 [Sphingobacteriaceae bacterium]